MDTLILRFKKYHSSLKWQSLRLGLLVETVFLNLNGIRYKWENVGNGRIVIASTQIHTSDFSIGILSENSFLEVKLKPKALFFDLGNTLVSRNKETDKFAAYPETNTILTNLKAKGIELGVISDGSRSQLETLLVDQSLLDRFRIIVMSDDEDVGGIRKPKAKIFSVAIAKMRSALGFDLIPSQTAFLTETVDHFKVYNFLYTMGLKRIIANNCQQFVDH
jgi:Haloacid dehalogenase-like hydrolase